MENAEVTDVHHETQVTSRRDLYQRVTDTIIQQLEKGTVPWQQPWVGDNKGYLQIPYNLASQKAYRGINIVLLWSAALERNFTSNQWATFKQWKAKGESIRKDEKGSLIVYYDTFDSEEDGEIKKIPFLKHSIVFNKSQLGSYDPAKEIVHQPNQVSLVQRIEQVDQFVANTKATIEHWDKGACFLPFEDKICMPKPEMFCDTKTATAQEGYYTTLLHELTHWSGHHKRLNRQYGKKFGDQAYAQEELVAELGAAFLSAEFDITNVYNGDHAAYIAHWIQVLKKNKHSIIAAASEASKAVEYVRGLQHSVDF
jgi:antirestriction protein ArdC